MEQLEKQFSGMCLDKDNQEQNKHQESPEQEQIKTILAKQHLKQIKMLGLMKLMNLYTVLNQNDENDFFFFSG